MIKEFIYKRIIPYLLVFCMVMTASDWGCLVTYAAENIQLSDEERLRLYIQESVKPTNEILIDKEDGRPILTILAKDNHIEACIEKPDYAALNLLSIQFLTRLFQFEEIKIVEINGLKHELNRKENPNTTESDQFNLMFLTAYGVLGDGMTQQEFTDYLMGEMNTLTIGAMDGGDADIIVHAVNEEGQEYSVNYTIEFYNRYHDLVIHYVDQNGKSLAEDHKETLKIGDSYNVTSPIFENYKIDSKDSVISGTMEKRNIEVDVVYEYVKPTSWVHYYIGDGNDPWESYVFEEGAKFVSENPSKEGHTFSGWTWKDEEGNEISQPDTVPTYDVYAYGSYSVNSYDLIYRVDGIEHKKTSLDYGTEIIPEEMPVKNGYTFSGWKWYDENGSEIDEPETMPAHNVTATGTYDIIDYTVIFNDYDGKEIHRNEEPYRYGDMIKAPSNPIRTADKTYTYAFAGWKEEGGEGSLITDFSDVTVRKDVTYTAVYRETYINYKVKFQNWDGSNGTEKSDYHYGDAIIPPDTEMTREDDDTYSYVFVGWTPDGGTTVIQDLSEVTVTDNMTYTAYFEPTYLEWNIEFYNGDKRISYGTYHTGDEIAVPENPTKAEDKEYIYEFDGWNPPLEAIASKDVTYYAQYKATPKQYTVRFLTQDGAVLSVATVQYHRNITIPAAPVLEGTEAYSYEFKGWKSDALGELDASATSYSVEGSGDFIAVYEKVGQEYKVSFHNEDGSLIKTDKYFYGDSVIEPAQPEKEPTPGVKYVFSGWRKGGTDTVLTNLSMETVTQDVTYTAVFTEKTVFYRVIFKNWNDDILSNTIYQYDAVAVTPSVPTKAEDNTYTYEFAGWEPEFTNPVKGNATYTAKFDSVFKNYTVRFIGADGTKFSEKKDYHYGDVINNIPDAPSKEADDVYTYTFAGWKKNGSESLYSSEELANTVIKGNVEYTASYTKQYIDYEIIFNNYDGTQISKKAYHYGDKVVIPAEPESYEKDGYTYTFTGWSPNVAEMVEGNAVYTAQFSNNINTFIVTFYNDNGTEVLDRRVVGYGGTAVYTGSTVTKESSNYNDYTFDKWVTAPNGTQEAKLNEPVYASMDVYACFTATPREYVVTFLDEDDSVLAEDTYTYYERIIEPDRPVKEMDNYYEYTFAGWDNMVGPVTGNQVFKAQYDKTLREYAVTINVDGLIQTQYYNYGQYVNLDEIPAKNSTAQHSYIFTGWKKNEEEKLVSDLTSEVVKADVTYEAQFEQKVNQYKVTFYNEDGIDILGTIQVDYGTEATFPGQSPEKAGTTTHTYSFNKWVTKKGGFWEADLSNITEDVAVYASFDENIRYYTVTFVSGDKKTEETYTYNEKVSNRKNPVKESDGYNTYTFLGWRRSDGTMITDISAETVTKNQTYTEIYQETAIPYTVTWIVDGAETVETYYYKDVLRIPANPVKAATPEFTYTFEGWVKNDAAEIVSDMSAEKVLANVTYTAKFSAVTNEYTVLFYNDNGTPLGSSKVKYGTSAIAPKNPVKDMTAESVYTFEKWDKDFSYVTENMTVTAVYKTEPRPYKIRWNIDGKVTETEIAYGTMPIFSGLVEKNSTPKYKYIFTGWDKEITLVDGEKTYIAQFKTELNYVARIGQEYYKSVKEAMNVAKSGDYVYIDKDCIISEDVTVPKGVILFLPCQDGDEAFVPSMEVYNPSGKGTSGQPSLYRTVTVDKDATVTIKGTVIVNAISGNETSTGRDHAISGGYSQMILNGNIVVENGGLLDVYGYVKGEGSVHVKNGGKVYDLYIVRHWRGGTQGYAMYLKRVYPMNEIDCHNIQTPIRIDYGASYEGTVRMYANDGSGAKYYCTRFPQVNVSNGLIRLNNTEGFVEKSFENGREVYSIYGGADFSQSTLNIVGMDLSTSRFVYPIDGDITINLNDGDYLFKEDYKFMPGAQLNLGSGAHLTLDKRVKLALYEEFNDVDNTGNTEYPSGRDPVIMQMADGSSFEINGYFGGKIHAGDVSILRGSNAELSLATREANGYNNGYIEITNEFALSREGYIYEWIDDKVVWKCETDASHKYVDWVNGVEVGTQYTTCTICGKKLSRQNAADYLSQMIESASNSSSAEEKKTKMENARILADCLSEEELQSVTNLDVLEAYEEAQRQEEIRLEQERIEKENALKEYQAKVAFEMIVNQAKTASVDNLKLEDRKEDTLVFTWGAKTGIAGYRIAIKDGAENLVSLMETTANNCKVMGLTYANHYTCIVSPITMIKGDKYYGTETSVSITTSAGTAEDLRVTKRSTSTLTLEWKQANHSVNGYMVQLLLSGNVKKTIYTAKTTYKFTKLSAGTVYNLSVVPYIDKDGTRIYGESFVSTSTTSPKQVKVKKLTTPAKRSIKLTWKKVKCSGYQIMVATNNKFTRGVKKYKIGGKSTSKKITKLKRGKKYYVKIRAFRKCNGSTYYGKWSKYKTIKCK